MTCLVCYLKIGKAIAGCPVCGLHHEIQEAARQHAAAGRSAGLPIATLARLACCGMSGKPCLSLAERSDKSCAAEQVCTGMLCPTCCHTWPAMKMRWRASSWNVVFMTTMRAFRSLFNRASGNTAAKGRSRGASAGKQKSKGM